LIAYRADVITRVDGWRGLLVRAGQGYQRWEDRRRPKLSAWSTRRRWLVLVLLPSLLCCCGGGVIGVPVVWFLRETESAGKGAPAPDAAADDYLMALGYGQEEGLLPLLDDEHQDELLSQWRDYRAAMQGTDPPPARFDFAGLKVGPIEHGRAEVTTDVRAAWWITEDNGRISMYDSEAFTWRIETREDDGWRVTKVEAPVWCGGYVLASKCRTG
jgi:hypothetical protein